MPSTVNNTTEDVVLFTSSAHGYLGKLPSEVDIGSQDLVNKNSLVEKDTTNEEDVDVAIC